jgi:O-antigen/teichoic acid export membrane protein
LEDSAPAEASFRRRYAAKLATNVAGLAVSFVNVSVLPRALGPSAYGSFEFLTAFFQNMSGFWDMGTSTAFFTKLSRRNQDGGVLRFYIAYTSLVAVVIVLAVGAVAEFGFGRLVWPEQRWRYIVLAAALGYLTWVSEVCRKAVDAFGLTVSGELVVLGMRAIGALAVVGLFLSGWLSLTTLFVKEQVLAAVVTVGLCGLAVRHWRGHLRAHAMRSPGAQVRREFWTYCSPLIAYSLVGVVTSLADRWILQAFAGSKEQGFYGLAYRVAAVSFIFSVAMTQLLQREFSRAHGAADLVAMRHLFRRYIPLLYTITAYFAAFTSAQTATLVSFMGGDAFAPAVPATMLMTLYPVHQTYGQLSGSVFYATDQTALYRNIGVLSMAVGLVLTWLVLAPHAYGGLAAGSEGLAAKMLLAQFLGVNLQLWFNLKHLKLSFSRFLLHQVVVVATFLALARVSTWTVHQAGLSRVPEFISSGAFYTLLVAAVFLRWPQMAGLSREDVRRFTARLSAAWSRSNG